jgi:hypothetical protein
MEITIVRRRGASEHSGPKFKKTEGVLRAVSFIIILCFSSCVSQQKVMVGVSGQLAASYGAYPSIEVDIAAVTDGELAEIKDAGVENYFAPDSGIREKIGAQTLFFSEEQTKPLTLPSRAAIWKSWLQKDPSTLVIIAGLPYDPGMPDPPAPDPRIMTVPLKKRLIFAPNVYVLAEPKKITRVKRPPVNPQTDFPKTDS